jgi:hypothetical protein
MTTRIIRRIIFIVLVELAVPVQMELPSLFLLLIVSSCSKGHSLALLTLQQIRSRLAISSQFLLRPSSRSILVSWRWRAMEAAVAVADMVEADSVVVVAEAVEVRLFCHPLFHPLMGLTKVVVIRRFHLF